MSDEHKQYIKSQKKERYKIYGYQLSLLFIIILSWQILTDLKILDPFIVSSPKKVIKTIISLYQSNNLFIHINTTLFEIFISFVISLLIAIIFSSLLWFFPKFAKVFEPYLTILNSLPKVALGPIILIWFGTKTTSIIIMAILISCIVLIINIYNGFISIDPNKVKLIKSLTSNRLKLYIYLIFPANISTIISNMKICISMSLIGVIMGEFLVSKAGVGYLIMYGSQVFNLNLVVTGIFILAILSWIMYSIVYYIEKRLNK